MTNMEAKLVKREIFTHVTLAVGRMIGQWVGAQLDTFPGTTAMVKIPTTNGPRYFEIIVKEKY